MFPGRLPLLGTLFGRNEIEIAPLVFGACGRRKEEEPAMAIPPLVFDRNYPGQH